MTSPNMEPFPSLLIFPSFDEFVYLQIKDDSVD